MNINQTKKAIKVLFDSNVTPLLIGHRGIGKSELVKQYAKENGYGLVELRLGQADGAGDLIGLADFITDEKGAKIATKFITPHFLPKNGKWILFLDEINRATKDVLQAVFELVYDKSISINGYSLSEESHVIAAMNPSTDEYDTLEFKDSAFQDRFCHIKVEPNVKEWIKYGKSIKLNDNILNFIQELPEMLEPKLSDFPIDVQPSRRSWVAIDRVENNCDSNSLFLEIAQGLVGVEAAATYSKFKKEFERKITGKEVLNNYEKVKSIVLKYSHNDTNRADILRASCDDVVNEVSNLDKLTLVQENNLVEFLLDIPKDLSLSMTRHELTALKAFNNTESDSKNGLNENDTLYNYFSVVKNELKGTINVNSK